MTNETDTELQNDQAIDFQAQADAQADAAEMRRICAESLKGLRPHQTVYRLTSDMLRMGYPVPNPNAQYTGATVKDLTAFLSQ